jgi:hypothetical protein
MLPNVALIFILLARLPWAAPPSRVKNLGNWNPPTGRGLIVQLDRNPRSVGPNMKPRFSLLLLALLVTTCANAQQTPVELKHFALDSREGVRAVTGVHFDPRVSADGKGSVRVDVNGDMTVPLFEVTDVSVDEAILIYQASLQSQNLDGRAYLEMWVRIPGKGEFFSRALDRPVTGTMSWMTTAAPFFLQPGQTPDLIRLNLVVQGKGKVWIDDVKLMKAPLPHQ